MVMLPFSSIGNEPYVAKRGPSQSLESVFSGIEAPTGNPAAWTFLAPSRNIFQSQASTFFLSRFFASAGQIAWTSIPACVFHRSIRVSSGEVCEPIGEGRVTHF